MAVADLSLFPLKRPDLYKLYEQQVASFWTAHEIDMSQERAHFLRMTEGQQQFISMVLAFFASADLLIVDNLLQNFLGEFRDPSARLFLGFQAGMEGVHSQVYALLLDTTIPDKQQKDVLVNAHESIPSIAAKCEWVLQYFDKRKSFAARLVAFLAIEGIFFAGSFAAVFYAGTLGLCPGLCAANRFIARDESLHAEFAATVYCSLKNKLDRAALIQIIDDAVETEIRFVCDALPLRLLGMNAELMSQHIRSVADYWLERLGEPAFYGVKSPFDFMENLSLIPKGNFFETRESEYQLSTNRGEFGLSEDF